MRYTYDKNASMTLDYHRSVSVEYNLLNSLKKVINTLDIIKSTNYSYSSKGKKLNQTTINGGAVLNKKRLPNN